MNLNDIKQKAESARTQLLGQAKIFIPPFGWMSKERLDFGLRNGVIEKRGELYVLKIEEKEQLLTIGYRGRTPLTEKKISRDFSKVNAFFGFDEGRQSDDSQVDCEFKALVEKFASTSMQSKIYVDRTDAAT